MILVKLNNINIFYEYLLNFCLKKVTSTIITKKPDKKLSLFSKSFQVNFKILQKIQDKNENNSKKIMNFFSISPGKLSKNLEMKIQSMVQEEDFMQKIKKIDGISLNSQKNTNTITDETLEHMWEDIFAFFAKNSSD